MTEQSRTSRGVISGAQQAALAGLLDLDGTAGDVLPELWHWTQLLESPPQRTLGPDGHPRVGIPAPAAPGQQRMFAGGRVRTHRLLRTGEPAERTTVLQDSVTKHGRTGPLTFVTVRHTYTQDGTVCVVEENDIVYRDAGSTLEVTPGTLETPGPEIGDGPGLRIAVDETFLFRFSALTYNAHRIHYDLGWAAHEGYPGLVVHGPLQALLMGELHRRYGAGLVGREFDFRLRAPMVGTQRVTVLPDPRGLDHGSQVLDAFGTVTATATLTPLSD